MSTLDFATLTETQRAIMIAALSDTCPVVPPARSGRDVAALVQAGYLHAGTRAPGLFGKQNERQIAPTRQAWTAAREQRVTRLAQQRDVTAVASWHEPATAGKGWATCWPNGQRYE